MVQAVVPAYRLRIPVKHKAQVHEACRTALACHVASQPLRALLAQAGVAQAVSSIAQPAVQLLARASLQQLALQPGSMQAQLWQYQQLLALQQQRYNSSGLPPADVSSAQGCSNLLDSFSSRGRQSGAPPDVFRMEGRLRRMVAQHKMQAGFSNPQTRTAAWLLLAAVQLLKQRQLLERLLACCAAGAARSSCSGVSCISLSCSVSGPLGLLQNSLPSGLGGLLGYVASSSVPCVLAACSVQQELQQQSFQCHGLQLPLPVAVCLEPAAAAAAWPPGALQQAVLVELSDAEPKRGLDFTSGGSSGSQQQQKGTVRLWCCALDDLQEVTVPASSIWRLLDAVPASSAAARTAARGTSSSTASIGSSDTEHPSQCPAPQVHGNANSLHSAHSTHRQRQQQQSSVQHGLPGHSSSGAVAGAAAATSSNSSISSSSSGSSGSAAGQQGSQLLVALAPYEPPSKRPRLSGSSPQGHLTSQVAASQGASLAELAAAATAEVADQICTSPQQQPTLQLEAHMRQPQQHSQPQQQEAPRTTVAPVSPTHTLRGHLAPQQPGHRFAGCLLQHLELTLLASASRDALLLSALHRPDPLSHIAAALEPQQCFQRALQRLVPQQQPPQQQPGQPCRAVLQMLGIPSSGGELVALLLRGLVQGHGPKRLSEALHVERAHGMQLAQALLEAAPGIARLKELLLKQALEGGCSCAHMHAIATGGAESAWYAC
jgi:hypothetical protein